MLFGDQADGSKVEVDGEVVGSSLIAQPFKREAERGPGLERDPAYFQPRPSITGYSPNVTYFNNLGPNNLALSRYFANKAEAYLAREGEFTPGLELADVPVDAVTTSASGVDPHISEANAEIQANRVAEERGLDARRPCSTWSTSTPTIAPSACSASPASTCSSSTSRSTRRHRDRPTADDADRRDRCGSRSSTACASSTRAA